ncbi:MAG: hypothetical protein AB1807_21330 [Pseudomonadota bacterium]
MQNQEPKKLFAFQLAEKRAQAKPAQQWKVRDGVAVAGCTVLDEEFSPYRESNRNVGSDSGDYC